jgi:hypothetical protein
MHDPIVEEVRRHREEHARRFGYDLDAICEDLMASQRRNAHLLINRKVPPRATVPVRPGESQAQPSRS